MNIHILVIAFWAALAGALVSGLIVIPLLKKLKLRQTERDDGPQSHLVKAGTPSMGGFIFLIPVTIVSVIMFFIGEAPKIIPMVLVTLGFALVGFLDDLLKTLRHNKVGLKAWQKMLGLFIVAAAFSVYVGYFSDVGTVIDIEFFGLHGSLNLAWAFVPFTVFLMLAMTNAVNLTDGLDGLASGCSAFLFIAFSVIALVEGTHNSTAYFSIIFIGSLLGFLVFNFHPAKVFMGDLGSLALGGAMGACAVMMKKPLILLLAGLIFVIEAMSDILQVLYFKKTGGKRLFKMAPIHHHFELCGWKETKVVLVFWTFTAVCCGLAVLCVLL